MKSVFCDKNEAPDDDALRSALGNTFEIWNAIQRKVLERYPKAVSEWHFSGDKYGWSYRISDSRRVLIYLLPRKGFFKTAFVFGQKAFEQILAGDVSDAIKTELSAARKYAEGRGIRIDVTNSEILADIEKLIAIKIAN